MLEVLRFIEVKQKMFYKQGELSSSDLIIECLKSMLIPAYNNYKFYVISKF